MKKISEIVIGIITRQPFLEEALTYGFLNLTAFSEYIRSYVEKEVGKSVSVHAIKMTLSRISLPKLVTVETQVRFLKVSTRTNLSIMTLVRSPKAIELITAFMQEKRKDTSYFFTMVEGVHEIDIIFDSSRLSILEEQFPKGLQILTVSGLGLISCELSDREISTPGLFYRVTKRLAFSGVNIIQVLSTYHELGIILKEDDMKEAIGLLWD